MEWRMKMKICDNCGKKLEYLNSSSPVNFSVITIEIEAILDLYGHKKKLDLCQQCQKDIYNMIMDSEVQNIDFQI